jgi:hypothetical protein
VRDFGDACACAAALQRCEGRLVSFDRKLSGVDGISRLGLKAARRAAGLLLYAAVIPPACSAPEVARGADGNGDTGGAGGGGGASNGEAGALVVILDSGGYGGTAAGSSDSDAGAGGVAADDFEPCAGDTEEAVPLPIDMYLMVDISLSMLDPTTSGETKWDAVSAALSDFFTNDGIQDLGVGIQYFPLPNPEVPEVCQSDEDCGVGAPCHLRGCMNDPEWLSPCEDDDDCVFEMVDGPPEDYGPCIPFGGCPPEVEAGPDEACRCPDDDPDACLPYDSYCLNVDDCSADAYAEPAVEIAPLSENSDALQASLAAQEPDGMTTMGPALEGALDHTSEWLADNLDREVIVVLATDAFPNQCLNPGVDTQAEAVDEVADVAQAGYRGRPSINTFVIGVFSEDETETTQITLSIIAAAGGTQDAFMVEADSDVSEQFVAALEAIRTSAVSCVFEVPDPEWGTLDYGRVNVEIADGADSTTLFYVGSASECDSDRGWYYDVDPELDETPTRISICPASCDEYKATRGTLSIELGCSTLIK